MTNERPSADGNESGDFAGFADAADAVRRAESGDFAKFDEVELVDSDTEA